MRRPVIWSIVAIVAVSVAVLLLLLRAWCCPGRATRIDQPAPAPVPRIGTEPIPTPSEAEARAPTETQMRNVDFHIDRAAILHIHELRGTMRAKRTGAPLNFDDKTSFILRIERARIGVGAGTLDILMNHFVFNYAGAPLKDLRTTFKNGQMVQDGVMHKLIDIPFTMTADVSATRDGRLRLHATKIRISSINGLALLKVVGITMEKMLDLRKATGVTAEKNDLVIDVLKILPPPTIEARLSAARIEGSELMQLFDFGKNVPDMQMPVAAPNAMYYRHGTLRMGKLLMVDADMQVVDTDPSDPFDFYIDRYNDELVEGFSRNRPNYGLTVFMRDFADVGRPTRPGETRAP
jgi:hypothetical protein